MELFRFYAACLRHLPRTSWWLIGIISTLATFGGAAVAVTKPFDPEAVNTILVILLVLAVIVCILVVPWVQAFRIYQEQMREADRLRGELASRGTALVAARRAEAEALIENLSPADREALNYILVLSLATEEAVQEHVVGKRDLPVADLPGLERAGLVRRDMVGYWSVNPVFAEALRELFGKQ